MNTATLTTGTSTNRPAVGNEMPVGRRGVVLAVGALMIVALALRLRGLGATNLWLDESNSWLLTTYSIEHMLANLRHSPGGPLYFVLLKGWAALFGDSEAALRALSLLVSLPVVGLTYVIGARIASPRAAVIAAALAAVSPLELYFAQEARVYMFATLLSAGVVAAHLAWRGAAASRLRGGASVGRPARALAVYAVMSVLSLYTLGLTGLLLVALGLDAVLLLAAGDAPSVSPVAGRRRWSVAAFWLATQGVILLVCLPLFLAIVPSDAVSSQAWRGPLGVVGSLRNFCQYFLVAVHGLYFYPWDLIPAIRDHWAASLTIGLIIVFPLTIVALVAVFAYPPPRPLRGPARAVYLALLLPLAIGALISVRHELALTRYMLFVSPCAFVLLGAGVASAPSWVGRSALVVLLVSMGYGDAQYPTIRSRDTDFRPVADRLRTDAVPADTVLVQPPEAGVQLVYYLRSRSLTVCGIPAALRLSDALGAAPGGRTWIALDYRSASYNLVPDSLARTLAGTIVDDRFEGAGGQRVRLVEVDGASPSPSIAGVSAGLTGQQSSSQDRHNCQSMLRPTEESTSTRAKRTL